MNSYLEKGRYKKILGAGGMTLVELLIAVILVSVVILAGTAVWIAAQKAFTRVAAPYGTTMVQGELDLAMKHMIRSIRRAKKVDGDGEVGPPKRIVGNTEIVGHWDHDDDPDTPYRTFKYNWRGDDDPPFLDIEYDPNTAEGSTGDEEYFPDTKIVRVDDLKFDGVENDDFAYVKITITPQIMGPANTWVTYPNSDYVSGVTLTPEIKMSVP